jgi:hypothetical protein
MVGPTLARRQGCARVGGVVRRNRYRERRRLRLLLSAGAMMLTAACATTNEPLRSDLQSSAVDVQQCAGWFTKLDAAVVSSGVEDAETYKIPGFPYLRVNRFLASFRQQAETNPIVFATWEKDLRDLDALARTYELKNLPTQQLASLGVASKQEAVRLTNRCGLVFTKLDETIPSRTGTLVERAQVPDDYADWKRAAGLYPVVKVPFFQFAKGWQNEATAMFQQAMAGVTDQLEFTRYDPPDTRVSAQQVSAIFASAITDALGVPEFSDRDRETLFAAFAPVFEVETAADYDRFGPLRWGTGETPEVEVSRPVAYRRLAFTRYGGRTLVQLVYMIWFPERPAKNWLDPLSGRLDGIIFRVTLDQSGQPLVYDSIHDCGCYHMFFPTARVQPIPPPDPNIEWAFIPRTLPAISPPQRVLVRVTSASHYLTDVRPDVGGHGVPYALRDDSELRTLPLAEGSRSAFGPDGIVPGTERGERLVVWPLGIDDPGAMREWGRHATALVGRRQFDDADLIERRFAILPAAGSPGQSANRP